MYLESGAAESIQFVSTSAHLFPHRGQKVCVPKIGFRGIQPICFHIGAFVSTSGDYSGGLLWVGQRISDLAKYLNELATSGDYSGGLLWVGQRISDLDWHLPVL